MYKLIDWEFYKTEKISQESILNILNSFYNCVRKNKKLELEEFNLWRPTCSDIEINPKNWWSETIPQASKYEWNWYYNWEWAMKECEYLGKRMPTEEEWGEIVKPYGNDWKK